MRERYTINYLQCRFCTYPKCILNLYMAECRWYRNGNGIAYSSGQVDTHFEIYTIRQNQKKKDFYHRSIFFSFPKMNTIIMHTYGHTFDETMSKKITHYVYFINRLKLLIIILWRVSSPYHLYKFIRVPTKVYKKQTFSARLKFDFHSERHKADWVANLYFHKASLGMDTQSQLQLQLHFSSHMWQSIFQLIRSGLQKKPTWRCWYWFASFFEFDLF